MCAAGAFHSAAPHWLPAGPEADGATCRAGAGSASPASAQAPRANLGLGGRHDWLGSALQALINGASGFVGGHLSRALQCAGWVVSARRPPTPPPADKPPYAGRVVFHLAALAHRAGGRHHRRLWLSVNRDLAVREYEAAAAAGASGFVFVSSAKVLGEASATPLAEDAPHAPEGIYAESKHLAERALRDAHERLRLPLAIVRPPLVYGAGVKAGFRVLLSAVERWPVLPLGAATAPRSMVSVRNLCSFLRQLGAHLEGCTTWHVTDGEPVSAKELVARLARAMRRRVLVPRLPVACLLGGAALAGQRRGVGTLLRPFLLDDGAARRALGWRPPQSLEEALAETAQWHLKTTRPR